MRSPSPSDIPPMLVASAIMVAVIVIFGITPAVMPQRDS